MLEMAFGSLHDNIEELFFERVENLKKFVINPVDLDIVNSFDEADASLCSFFIESANLSNEF